jgi:hypothetical protein
MEIYYLKSMINFFKTKICIFTTLYQFTHQSRYFVAFIPTVRSQVV